MAGRRRLAAALSVAAIWREEGRGVNGGLS
jgi:hypothetical protein